MLPNSQILWGAVSHAVRRPTRTDDDIEVFEPGGVLLVRGGDDFESERLIASEVGYRVRPSTALSLRRDRLHPRVHDLRSQEAPLDGSGAAHAGQHARRAVARDRAGHQLPAGHLVADARRVDMARHLDPAQQRQPRRQRRRERDERSRVTCSDSARRSICRATSSSTSYFARLTTCRIRPCPRIPR